MTPRVYASFLEELEKLAEAGLEEPAPRISVPAIARREIAAEAYELRKLAAEEPGFFTRQWRNLKGDVQGVHQDLKTPKKSLINAFRENYTNFRHPDGSFNSGKALFGGLMAYGTYQQAKSALPKEDPTGRGRSRAERVGSLVGGTAAGLLTMPHTRFMWGFPLGIAASVGGESIGGRIGRLVSGRRRANVQSQNHPAPAPSPQPTIQQNPPQAASAPY